jgi:hypothetical protein
MSRSDATWRAAWRRAMPSGDATLGVDAAHAGRNVSVALPPDLQIDTHGALQSLQMGLLPITELDGTLGAQYRSANGAEMRVDFLTSLTRSAKPGRGRGWRQRVLEGKEALLRLAPELDTGALWSK